MQSKYTDQAVVCAICGQWISEGEPRRYNAKSKVSAHDACVGAKIMGDHVGGNPAAPVPPPPQASPERDPTEERIERMHAENVDAAKAIADEIRRLKASVIETNMLLSVFVEAFVKRPPEGGA